MGVELDVLTRRIEEARALLAGIRIPDGPQYYAKVAVTGYLWTAIATGDSLVAVIRGSAVRGAEPLKRVLHECLLDLLFLTSDPEQEFVAAKIFMSEIRAKRRLVKDYLEVRRMHPEYGFPPVPDHWAPFGDPVEDTLAKLRAMSVSLGGSADVFTKAWQALEDSRQWHWSGLSRKRMIEVLGKRGRLKESGEYTAGGLTNMYNEGAHAAPAWADLPPQEGDVPFPSPAPDTERDLEMMAHNGSEFLKGIIDVVRTYFDIAEAA